MMNRFRRLATEHTIGVRALAVPLALVICAPSASAQARRADDTSPVGAPAPELSARREIVLSGLGGGMLAVGFLWTGDQRVVPAQGLDPADIAWSPDRSEIGDRSLRAGTVSDWTRDASLAFPIVLATITGEPGARLAGFRARGVVYIETLMASAGPALVGKSAFSRPRPYAYLDEAARPADPRYDVLQAHTFTSMPSGHSTSAWTGVSLAMTEELLTRPGSSWLERTAVGFVGGGLAGATSALRVEAGQHFPSDVLAGAGLGIATGIAVPLLHRGARPMPSTKAWLETWAGALAGAGLGVLLSG